MYSYLLSYDDQLLSSRRLGLSVIDTPAAEDDGTSQHSPFWFASPFLIDGQLAAAVCFVGRNKLWSRAFPSSSPSVQKFQLLPGNFES